MFELAEERFAEIDRKLPGYIVEVVEETAPADGRDAVQGDPGSEQHADPEPEPDTEPEPEADPDPEDVKAKAKAPASKSSKASSK